LVVRIRPVSLLKKVLISEKSKAVKLAMVSI
jgi:hypothetical protein